MNIKFQKAQLIYKSVDYIRKKRYWLVQDLIAYIDDPVRYRRRLRFLTELAQYEAQLMAKLENFESENQTDFDAETVKRIENEIDVITAISA